MYYLLAAHSDFLDTPVLIYTVFSIVLFVLGYI